MGWVRAAVQLFLLHLCTRQSQVWRSPLCEQEPQPASSRAPHGSGQPLLPMRSHFPLPTLATPPSRSSPQLLTRLLDVKQMVLFPPAAGILLCALPWMGWLWPQPPSPLCFHHKAPTGVVPELPQPAAGWALPPAANFPGCTLLTPALRLLHAPLMRCSPRQLAQPLSRCLSRPHSGALLACTGSHSWGLPHTARAITLVSTHSTVGGFLKGFKLFLV